MEQGGRAIETAMVGREGLIGGIVALGCTTSHGQVLCQVDTRAIKMPRSDFLRCFAAAPTFSRLVNLHIDNLLSQAQQNALCHAVHPIEARFCRWLLQVSDRLESNILPFTQEACSLALGVQRTSVSMVAHALQRRGVMRTRRGNIGISNRPELETAACECYAKSNRVPEHESPDQP